MLYKDCYFDIYVNALRIVTLFVFSYFLCGSVIAAQVGSYDHKNQRAFIIEEGFLNKNISQSRLIFVDFIKKTTKIISSGKNLSRLSVNPQATFLIYTGEKDLYVFDINNWNSPGKFSGINGNVVWDKLGMRAAGINYYDNTLFEINIPNFEIISIENPGNSLWGIKWDDKCKCFLYEISYDQFSNHFIGSVDNNNEFIKIKGKTNLSYFSNEKLIVDSRESNVDEGYSELRVILNDNEKQQIFDFASGIPVKSFDFLWGNQTLRILNARALININSGKLMYPSRYIFNNAQLRSHAKLKYIDIAADEKGYVLIWNMISKRFEVEDINSGKIVKTYKKFW